MPLPVPEALVKAMAEKKVTADQKKRDSGSTSPLSPRTILSKATRLRSPKKTSAAGSPGTRSPGHAPQSSSPSRMSSLISLKQPGSASATGGPGIYSPNTASKRASRRIPHRDKSPANVAPSGTSINPSESTAAADASTPGTIAASSVHSTESKEARSAIAQHKADATHKPPQHNAPVHHEPPDAKATDQKAAGSTAATSYCDFPPEALCCFAVLVLAAVITVLFIGIYISSSRNQTAEALRSAPEFLAVCAGDAALPGCHNVTRYMLDAMNPDVLPCVDFYENVCGRWLVESSDRLPYREEHVRLFNHRVADALLSRATQSENSSEQLGLQDQMALLFSSCFSMAAGYRKASNVTAVLAVISADARRWTQVPTFGAFLDLVVSTALRSGLPSFIRIQLFRGRPYRVDIGETLASTFPERVHEAKTFVSTVFRDLDAELPSSSTNSTAVFLIDRRVESARARANGQPWTALRSLEELKSIASEVLWKNALERGLPSTLTSASESKDKPAVEVRGADSIRIAIDHLRQQRLQSAGLYALIVLLAQVMKYALNEEQAKATPLDLSVAGCLHLTAENFGWLYPFWVARIFQRRSEVMGARSLFQDIVATVTNDRRVNAGVLIGTDRLKKTRLFVYDDAGNETLPAMPLVVTVGPEFLANFAALAAARVGGEEPPPKHHWLPQLRSDIGYSGDGQFLISSAYLSGIGIFADVSADSNLRTTARYATLGALILRIIFDSDATYFPPWSSGYIDQCFASSASTALGQPVNKRLARAIMRSRWSSLLAGRLKSGLLSEVSIPEANEQMNVANGTSTDHDKLFFRLLCFFECGEQDGRQLCNDMAALDHQFAEAFQCPRTADERRGACDCYGMNHCKTHLPVTGMQNNGIKANL